MEVWKIISLSKWVICRFHVNLPGCTWNESSHSKTPSDKAGHSKAAHHKQKLPMQSQAELPHKDQVEPHLKLLLVRDWWRLLSWCEFQLPPSGHSIYNSCDDITYYIHHSQIKLYDPAKITHDMVLKWPCHTPPCPHENLCLRELRFLHRIMALKVHLTGVSSWICWSNASWHFFSKPAASEHHPWSMSKFWENKVMVVILAHHTWSPQPSPREWKAKSWVAPQLLRKAVWLCWPLASLQPPDFFGRARAVVWFPCRRDLGEWLDMDSRRKGFFCSKNGPDLHGWFQMVPVFQFEKTQTMSYLAEIQEESSWLLHWKISHIPTTSHQTATRCLASTSVSPWVLPDLPHPEANGKTSLFWNKKTSNGWLISLLTVYQLVQLFQTSKTPNR